MFENAQESVVVTDAARTIVMVNAAFCRLTGFASEDVLGKPSFQLVAGASDERAQAQLWAEVDAQGCWQGELWGCRKDDDPFPSWSASARCATSMARSSTTCRCSSTSRGSRPRKNASTTWRTMTR
ncbi:MAG: PAS domain-containing protein [Uliginosibacterium sp.]|nr:PAS domain-containing protein [Uliginosibacterium sp.]